MASHPRSATTQNIEYLTIRKTYLNFNLCKKLANSIDNVTGTDILNITQLNLHQWPQKNCPRELTYGWQKKIRKFLKSNLKRNSALSTLKSPTLHDYYMWSHFCAIGTQNRNNCNSWLDVSRFYKPLTIDINNITSTNNAKSRYKGLLAQMAEFDETVTCTCNQHDLKLIYYTESTIGRQLLVGSTCILKEWFNCVLHYCREKQWYNIDDLKQIYKSVTNLQKQALADIDKILYRLNNEIVRDDAEIKYLIDRCNLCKEFILHALETKKKRNRKKKTIEDEFEKEICGMCILQNIEEKINDVNGLDWTRSRKDALIGKLKQICYEQECSEIKKLVNPIYLQYWYNPLPNKELTRVYDEDILENYYIAHQDKYEKVFTDNQLDNLYNLTQKIIDELEFKTNEKNLKKHIKKMKKEEKEKKKAAKLEKYNRLKYYYRLHIDPEYYRVAGWKLTRFGEKLWKLWKKRRDWLRQYVEDEQWFQGDKFQVIKYNWVARATHLTNILDDALEGKWNEQYVDKVLRWCDYDEYY